MRYGYCLIIHIKFVVYTKIILKFVILIFMYNNLKDNNRMWLPNKRYRDLTTSE